MVSSPLPSKLLLILQHPSCNAPFSMQPSSGSVPPPPRIPPSQITLPQPQPSRARRVRWLALPPPQPAGAGLWAGPRQGLFDVEAATWWVWIPASASRRGRVSDIKQRRRCHPFPPSSLKGCQLPARGPPPPPGVLLLQLGQGGVNGWDVRTMGAGRDPAAPPVSSWLPQSVPGVGLSQRGLHGCQGQPGDLAGPRGNPVVWHLGHCLGRQPGQRSGLSQAPGAS